MKITDLFLKNQTDFIHFEGLWYQIDKKGNFADSQVSDPSKEEGQELIRQIEAVLNRK
jgi:hypothetical protein